MTQPNPPQPVGEDRRAWAYSRDELEAQRLVACQFAALEGTEDIHPDFKSAAYEDILAWRKRTLASLTAAERRAEEEKAEKYRWKGRAEEAEGGWAEAREKIKWLTEEAGRSIENEAKADQAQARADSLEAALRDVLPFLGWNEAEREAVERAHALLDD